MIVKTITCHDVYNAGASLQAYALQKYLTNQGHDVEIINYKPDYLSRHYSLSAVSNPRYDKPAVKQLYLLAKLPSRLKAKKSSRKKAFDDFTDQYLTLTKRYDSFNALVNDPPKADAFIAGSDQIWNPLFPNGKDPAFFLQFVNRGKKVSYAASIAADHLDNADRERMRGWLETFDFISVREESAVCQIKGMSLDVQRVCDPVFLLTKEEWDGLPGNIEGIQKPYIFLYDFDTGSLVSDIIKKIGNDKMSVISWFDHPGSDKVVQGGPLEFIRLIQNADLVISNSFHATAFSLIFGVETLVVRRQETINSRMEELLNRFGIRDRLIKDVSDIEIIKPIDWNSIKEIIIKETADAEDFLNKAINE